MPQYATDRPERLARERRAGLPNWRTPSEHRRVGLPIAMHQLYLHQRRRKSSSNHIPTRNHATINTLTLAIHIFSPIQAQCASLRITDCNQLAREWSRESILADDVCSAQCGLVLQNGGQPARFTRSRTINSFQFPDFNFPDLTQFVG